VTFTYLKGKFRLTHAFVYYRLFTSWFIVLGESYPSDLLNHFIAFGITWLIIVGQNTGLKLCYGITDDADLWYERAIFLSS